MKRHKITCAEKKKQYYSKSEYKRAVVEIVRVGTMKRLNSEFEKMLVVS